MSSNEAIIVALIATVPPTITAIASLLASLRNHESIKRLGTDINGRMEQLVDSKEKAAHAKGKLEQSLEDKATMAEVVKADKVRNEGKMPPP
jgi:hypothetical protein